MIASLMARNILTSVLGAAVQAVARDADGPVITPLNADAVEKALVEKAVQIPEIVNAVNAEPPIASRILWGIGLAGSGATGLASAPIGELVAAVAAVLAAFGVTLSAEDQATWIEAGNSAIVLAGLAYAAYGRLRPGLAPMWPRIRAFWARITGRAPAVQSRLPRSPP